MILGIEKNASNEEIKKVYKNLLIKWYPYKNPNCNNGKFQKILESYDILSDFEKRKNYDNYRMNMINKENKEKKLKLDKL
jgi:DnaJ-class molecular chaperone